MAKEGTEERRDEGQRLLGTSINNCNAACSQITLASYRAPAELHHARPVRLQRSVCSLNPPWPGWALPACCPRGRCSLAAAGAAGRWAEHHAAGTRPQPTPQPQGLQ